MGDSLREDDSASESEAALGALPRQSRTSRASTALSARRSGKIVLSCFALPLALRTAVSDLFRKVMKHVLARGLKAVPCRGVLLGLRRSVRVAWTEPSQLIPHDDDIDCVYVGTFAAWQRVDWRSYGLVFTDLRSQKRKGEYRADFSLHAAASIHTQWPFVEFFRPRASGADADLLASAALHSLVLWPRPQRPLLCYLPSLDAAQAWLFEYYSPRCLTEAVIDTPHLPPSVTRRFPVPPAGAVFSASTGELLRTEAVAVAGAVAEAVAGAEANPVDRAGKKRKRRVL